MAMCNYEMRRHSQSENIYPVTKQSPSSRFALVINNVNFYDQRLTRHGAVKDEEVMVKILQSLGYNMDRFRNLTAKKIDEALKHFSRNPKLVHADSVFVVLMSHGDLRTMLGIDSERFEISKICEHLRVNSCPALKDKPKIIILQASKGVFIQGKGVLGYNLIASPPPSPDRELHIEKDFISLYCVAPHVTGYKHELVNSFFLQTVLAVFTDHRFKDHIAEIFQKIIARFHLAGVEKTMTIVQERTLTKFFYLFPRKEQLIERQEQLYRTAASLSVEPAGIQWNRSHLMKYSYTPIIDMNTVNRKLKLTDSSKKVAYASALQSYPDHPDRFDRPQFMCKHGVTARSYWEVKWHGEVYIAVSYKGIPRKGEGNETLFGWNDQSWSLYCSDKCSVWHNNKEIAITNTLDHNSRIGVYVDCYAGTLSFFSVSYNTLIHLHTFQITFTEPVYPGFRVFTSSYLHL